MKRGLTIVVNITVIAFIIIFITVYTSQKNEESNRHELTVFQNTAVTAGQIIANYLADEQHLCDIWASYINHYASVAGYPMTIEEAIEFTRRASISDQVEAHIIFYDDGSFGGLSSTSGLKGGEDYSVSYKGYSLFADFSEDELNNEIRQTAAFANPTNGVLSMAFINTLTLQDTTSGEARKALLMRIIPISELSRKLVYLKGEFEDVDMAIIDSDGKYMIHGSQLKNSNLFEYYKSYNNTGYQQQREFESQVTGDSGLVEITNSKGHQCVVAHTPVTSDQDWFLINIIPKASLLHDDVDWTLLGITIAGLVALLMHNMASMMIFNRRLAATAEEAKKANAAKSNFLSMMSHDIRTPMNAITGFNEMIRRESRDPNILRYSESIRIADNTLLSLINDILDFSKLEAGKLDIIPAEYDLVSVLNDLVSMIQVRTEEKKLDLQVQIDSNIPRHLFGDELRIKQCILNLLSNAMKYTAAGWIQFTVGYEPCPDKDSCILLKVRVADSGCGIRQEDIDKLFVAFQRLEEDKNRNIEGSGLGLSITQSLLVAMGSSLAVESEYGKGSVFSFAVQQEMRGTEIVGDYEEAFRQAMEAKGGYEGGILAPTARILVVDDAPLNLSVFVSLLKTTQMMIDTASSGRECLKLCENNSYDVIFLDHMMPEMDGIETLHVLRKQSDGNHAATPVICLTANAIAGMREKFLEEGFTDYLTKPIDFQRLEQMLLKYLPSEKVSLVDATVSEEKANLPEGLYRISQLDVNAGLSHCGDVKSYLDTLQMYSQEADGIREEILRYMESGDDKNLTIKLHALKSTSKLIGAMGLGELAEHLEAAGNSGQLEAEKASLDAFLDSYRALTRALEEVVGSEELDGKAPVAESPPMTSEEKHHILLVDDDPLYSKMVRSWLSEHYGVTAVKEGRQALAYLQNHAVDLILLDYEMKDMNGAEVLSTLRGNTATKDVPVMFLTGRADEKTMEQVKQQSVAGYLVKTMDRDTIVQTIDDFFDTNIELEETEE